MNVDSPCEMLSEIAPTRVNIFVDYAYACFGGGHERPGLGEQRYQTALPEQCRFTGHVGPGYYHYLLFLVVETYVVGYVGLAYGHQAFYYGGDARPLSLLRRRPIGWGDNIRSRGL